MPGMTRVEYNRQWCRENPDKVRQYKIKYHGKYHQAYRIKLKTTALTYYGNGKMSCVLCGEEDIRCLSLDHINGGGHQHRKSLGSKGRGGFHFYLWLIKHGLPEGYRTLCMNCQFKERDKIYKKE